MRVALFAVTVIVALWWRGYADAIDTVGGMALGWVIGDAILWWVRLGYARSFLWMCGWHGDCACPRCR